MGYKAVKIFFRVGFIFISISLLIITVLLNFFKYVQPPEMIWLQFITILSPFIIISNIILFSVWAYNLKFRAIIPLLSIIIGYKLLFSMLGFRLSEKDPNAEQLIVSSFNVNYFSYKKEFNTPIIAKLMAENKVEILSMQEFEPTSFFNLKEIIGEFDFLQYNTIDITEGKIGMAIFSKYQIIQGGKINFENSDNGSLWADIKYKEDTIRIINNHLQTTGFYSSYDKGPKYVIDQMKVNYTKRAKQAILIKEFIKSSPYPVISMGDLNDTPNSFTYSTLIEAGLGDSFKKAKLQSGGTYMRTLGLLRIDYIMHTHHFKTIYYKKVRTGLSDHKPIFSVLEYQN
jgi:endonuclease/exonuclease/phosphatase family metal-dependent hydrolase